MAPASNVYMSWEEWALFEPYNWFEHWTTYHFYDYVSQELFDPVAEEDIIRPATKLPPHERAMVQSNLRPGHLLLGRIPYEGHQPHDYIGLRAETSTLFRPSFDQTKRRYLVFDISNSMKIPADGSTSNMEPKVFQLSDENHGSAVHTMFQNFREVSTRSFTFLL